MALADTTFLIDLMRGRERAIDMLERLEDAGEPIHVASVTLYEFHRGLETVDLPLAEKRRIVEAVEGRVVRALDADAAARAGQLDARLWSAGDALDPEDAMIAGIALARDEEVVTRRAKEFGRVPGLRLRTY